MNGFSGDVASKIDFGVPLAYRVEGGVINTNTTVTLGFNDDLFWST